MPNQNHLPRLGVDRRTVELNLIEMPESAQGILAASRNSDAEDDAIGDAQTKKRNRSQDEISRAAIELGEVERQLSDPAAQLDRPRLEKLAAKLTAALAQKRAELKALSKPSKKSSKPAFQRKPTSEIESFIASRKRAQRPVVIDVPSQFSKSDGLAKVREAIDAQHKRIDELFNARLPPEEAFDRFKGSVLRLTTSADSIPFGEYTRVRKSETGRMTINPVDVPPAIYQRAIEAFVLAYGEDRLKKIYDRIEFDEEILSMAHRKRELAKVNAEIERLEWIEGELIRRAVSAGDESIKIRKGMNVQALLGLEDDPESPGPQKAEIMEGPSGTPASSFARRALNAN